MRPDLFIFKLSGIKKMELNEGRHQGGMVKYLHELFLFFIFIFFWIKFSPPPRSSMELMNAI